MTALLLAALLSAQVHTDHKGPALRLTVRGEVLAVTELRGETYAVAPGVYHVELEGITTGTPTAALVRESYLVAAPGPVACAWDGHGFAFEGPGVFAVRLNPDAARIAAR